MHEKLTVYIINYHDFSFSSLTGLVNNNLCKIILLETIVPKRRNCSQC